MGLTYTGAGFVLAMIAWATLLWMLFSVRKIMKGEIKNFINWIFISFTLITFKTILDAMLYVNLEYQFLGYSYRAIFLRLGAVTGIIIVLCFFKAIYELSKFADAYGFAVLNKRTQK
jgi:hypothetical protein